MSQDSYLKMKVSHVIANIDAKELIKGNLADEEMLTVARRINLEAGRQMRRMSPCAYSWRFFNTPMTRYPQILQCKQ